MTTLPSFDIIKIARSVVALEDAYEILMNIADKRFMNHRNEILQSEYDTWCSKLGYWFNERMYELTPQRADQEYSDFIEG